MDEKKTGEWSTAKKWNPFNSYKLLSQIYRWRLIKQGNPAPQPCLVTVDPINVCNLNCEWCNANYILNKNRQALSEKALLDIADFLPGWKGSPDWPQGVESVCIAGGGEPLMNVHIAKFIDRCVEKDIEVGVVTNGTNIDNFIESLSKCTWVGVSVDAGSKEIFKEIKKVNAYDKVIENMRNLIEHSMAHNTRLSRKGQGYGVSYKYLVSSLNIPEIFKAAQVAKSIGCRNFHMRPAGVPWFDVNDKSKHHYYSFDFSSIETFQEEIEKARRLEDEQFGVFGITHKFSSDFNAANLFKKCHAIFMTGVFMPGSDGDKDSINFGLCCDRRGDDLLVLEKNIKDVNLIGHSWGSQKHWDILSKIKVGTCPRCTYQPHNQIYEHAIQNDSMTYKFI